MPESNAAAKKRQQKANRAAGIGDEQGRLVKVKDPPKMALCTVCHLEMKITKTNTELKAHATSKHNSTLDACFPGAAATAEEMIAIAAGAKGKGAAAAAGGKVGAGPTKADKKAKDAAGLDDLLNAGLTAGKKKDKK
jgi:Zinc-binding